MLTANTSSKMSEDDWDMFKEHLRVMYLQQNISIKAIRDHMITTYHFDRSRQQYERKFAKWGFRKNHSQQEWRTVDLQLKRQYTTIDDARVEFDGRVIGTKRLKKALSRSVVTTLADKWLPNSTTSLTNHASNNKFKSVVSDCSSLVVRSTANHRVQFQPTTHIPLFEFWAQATKYLTKLVNYQVHTSCDSTTLSSSERLIDSRLICDVSIVDEHSAYNDHTEQYVTLDQGHPELDTLRPNTTLNKTAELNNLETLKSLREISGRISQFKESSIESSPYTTSVEVQGDIVAPLLHQLRHIFYLMSNNVPDSNRHYRANDHHRAIESTDVEILKTLLHHTRSSASLTVKAIILQMFQTALDTENLALARVLQSIGINMNSSVRAFDSNDQEFSCMTALQALVSKDGSLIKRDCAPILQFLMGNGANPNICGRYHSRHRTVHENSYIIDDTSFEADELLSDSDDFSCDVDDTKSSVCNLTKCSKGYTCCSVLPLGIVLHGAFSNKFLSPILEALIKGGAHICERLDLTAVIEHGCSDHIMIKFLLKHGAAPSNSARGDPMLWSSYYSPLQAAIATGNIQVAVELINSGASVEFISGEILRNSFRLEQLNPYSVLTLALLTDQDLAKKLIEKGAPINECHFDYDDLDDSKIEHVLTGEFDLGSTYEQILSGTFAERWTTLTVKCGKIIYRAFDDESLVHKMINTTAGYAFSPLQAAIASKSVEMVEVVLNAGGSLQCCHGTPPLVIAVRTQHPDFVRRLIDLGIDVNLATLDLDSRPWLLSPLAEADARNDIGSMSMLLAAGARVDHCDTQRGLTALQAAIVCRAHESIQYLISHCDPDVFHEGSVYGVDALSAAILIDNISVFTLLYVSTFSNSLPNTILVRVLPLAVEAVNKDFITLLLTTDLQIYSLSMIEACTATPLSFDWLQGFGFDLTEDVFGRNLGDEAFGYALNINNFWSLTPKQRAQRIQVGILILKQGGLPASKTFERLLVHFSDACIGDTKVVVEDIHPIEEIVKMYCASQAWNLTHELFNKLVPLILNLSPSYCACLVTNLIRIGYDLNTYSSCPCVITYSGQEGIQRRNYRSVTSYMTPLQAAATRQNIQAVDLLLRHGALPDSLAKPGNCIQWPTALQLSVQYANLPLAQLLIRFGADVNISPRVYLHPTCLGSSNWILEPTSHSLLGLAIHAHSTIWVYPRKNPWIQKLGFPTNAFKKDNWKRELEATHNLVILLLESGANVNVQASCRGESALQVAVAEWDINIVQELIAQGADVNAAASIQKYGKTALQAACERKNLEMMKVLLKNGANVNSPAGPDHGATALQYAAMNGHFQMVQILLGAGADVAAPASAKGGRTAINGAAEHGRLDIVKFLLDHYKGTESISTMCRQASRYAQREGHIVVVELLQEYELSTYVNRSPTP